jgi:DNA-binding NtrC family response regulator
MDLLQKAEWRGNVRELKNVLESAVVMSRGGKLLPEDFSPDTLGTGMESAGVAPDVGYLDIDDYRDARRQFEISFIKGKLQKHGGNITRTAAAIGLHRQSLQEKLRELGIQADRD